MVGLAGDTVAGHNLALSLLVVEKGIEIEGNNILAELVEYEVKIEQTMLDNQIF